MVKELSKLKKEKRLTRDDIASSILCSEDRHDYAYIIMGRPGPTGKSTLCKILKMQGLNVFEISESIVGQVVYTKEHNSIDIDILNKVITIVLNERVK